MRLGRRFAASATCDGAGGIVGDPATEALKLPTDRVASLPCATAIAMAILAGAATAIFRLSFRSRAQFGWLSQPHLPLNQWMRTDVPDPIHCLPWTDSSNGFDKLISRAAADVAEPALPQSVLLNWPIAPRWWPPAWLSLAPVFCCSSGIGFVG